MQKCQWWPRRRTYWSDLLLRGTVQSHFRDAIRHFAVIDRDAHFLDIYLDYFSTFVIKEHVWSHYIG